MSASTPVPRDLPSQTTNLITNIFRFLAGNPGSVLESVSIYIFNQDMAHYVLDRLRVEAPDVIPKCQVVGWRNGILVSAEVSAVFPPIKSRL